MTDTEIACEVAETHAKLAAIGEHIIAELKACPEDDAESIRNAEVFLSMPIEWPDDNIDDRASLSSSLRQKNTLDSEYKRRWKERKDGDRLFLWNTQNTNGGTI